MLRVVQRCSNRTKHFPLLWQRDITLKQNAISYGFCRHRSSSVLSGDTVRIGCASGFWGDTAVAAPQLIKTGKLDFLVFDYLSEITMSLLTAVKAKNPNMGYTPDFVQVSIAPYLKDIQKQGLRVISNSGGVNPHACGAALQAAIQKAGVDLKVAVVTGDDLIDRQNEFSSITEMESGKSLPASVTSMNAYLGAGPIARALDLGADIVVTGRCTDSALALGPLIHKFKWNMEDFNKMAAGSLAGHLIECAAQATGGILTDWHKVHDWDNIGFPIVECDSSGDLVLSKPPKTGGLVSKATASEQLVYEIGDPARYLLPDVACDFTNVQINDLDGIDGGAVHVTGAKGTPPTSTYKVSATCKDGYRALAVSVISGPRSVEKARKTGEAILKRVSRIYKQLGMSDFSKVHLQVLGSEQTYGPHANAGQGPREAVLWLAVRHQVKQALGIFAGEVAGAGTGMAPGLSALVGGRPKVSPVLKLFSFLYPKDQFKIDIHMNGEHVEQYVPPTVPTSDVKVTDKGQSSQSPQQPPSGSHSYRLEDLAYTRSGDKGNNCNIGVIARHPAYLPYLRQALTVEAVDQYMSHVFDKADGEDSRIKRYDIPGIHAMNFVLHNSLGGGGIASLRSDPQGKAYGQMLLDFRINNMPDKDDLIKST